MVKLTTRAFTIIGDSITAVVIQWNKIKTSFDQYEDIEILSIKPITKESNVKLDSATSKTPTSIDCQS